MEKIASKLEGIAEKLSKIIWESMEKKWEIENVKKGEKVSIFRVYKYNHQNQFGKKREKEEKESDMLSLHIPLEHCQFFVKNYHHQQQQPHSSWFDATNDTIVVTIGKQFEEWSFGKLKSAKSEIIFMPDIDGSQASNFSIELNFTNPNLLNQNSHSKIISISDQVFIAFLFISLCFLYTFISSFFKGK